MFGIGAIVSLCYVPGLTGAYIATQWPVLAVLLPFALWRSGPFTTLHLCMLAFIAYASVGLFYSPVTQAGVFGLWLVVITGLCLWFGTTLESPRQLYAGLALGAGVSSFVAVLQYFGFTYVPWVSGPPAGIYVNSVQQGTVLALLIVALVSERMWLWVLPLLPGFALAQSRGAWLILFAGLAACSFRRRPLLTVTAVLAVVTVYVVSPISASDAERLFIWRSAWDNLTWFGWGPGSFYTVLLSNNGVSFYLEYAHSDALQLVFEFGIGALFVFAIFVYVLRQSSAREWPVVVAFVTAGCYSMPLYMPIAAFLAFVAVGRILRADALAIGYGSDRGQFIVPWRRRNRREGFSVASYLATKGCRTWS